MGYTVLTKVSDRQCLGREWIVQFDPFVDFEWQLNAVAYRLLPIIGFSMNTARTSIGFGRKAEGQHAGSIALTLHRGKVDDDSGRFAGRGMIVTLRQWHEDLAS